MYMECAHIHVLTHNDTEHRFLLKHDTCVHTCWHLHTFKCHLCTLRALLHIVTFVDIYGVFILVITHSAHTYIYVHVNTPHTCIYIHGYKHYTLHVQTHNIDSDAHVTEPEPPTSDDPYAERRGRGRGACGKQGGWGSWQ